MSEDKLAAYQTLHTCMLTVAQLMSPFAPFLSEHLYQRLTVNFAQETAAESVHLALLPEPGMIDVNLKSRMNIAQRVVYLARGLREQTRIKTRITSYNVCYTKLLRGLDYAPEPRSEQQARLMLARELHGGDVDFMLTQGVLYECPVITSYSIHYTKLYYNCSSSLCSACRDG